MVKKARRMTHKTPRQRNTRRNRDKKGQPKVPETHSQSIPARQRCQNPWNGECKNTDIGLIIHYKGEFLPICHECWPLIVEAGKTW